MTGLYVIESIWGQVLRRLSFEPPYPQWFYRLDPVRVLYLGVTKGETTTDFVQDAGLWRFANPDRTPIDADRWAEVVPLLGGPPNLGIQEDRIDDLAKYGLLEPRAVVIIEYLPPEGIEAGNWESILEIGDPTPDGDPLLRPRAGSAFPAHPGRRLVRDHGAPCRRAARARRSRGCFSGAVASAPCPEIGATFESSR